MRYYKLIYNNASSDRVAITYDSITYKYNEMVHRVKQIASEFSKKGIKPKDKIVISTNGKITTLLAIIALNVIGAIAVPIYPKTGIYKIKLLIEGYGFDYFFSNIEVGQDIGLVNIMKFDSLGECYIGKFSLINHIEQPDDLALILFTSGTTGYPKGIMLSNSNIISNINSVSDYLGITERDTVLHIKSMYHSSSIIAEAILTLINGAHLVLFDGIVTPKKVYEYCNDMTVSILFSIPLIMQKLLVYMKKNNLSFKSIRLINFYGAPVQKEVLENLLVYYKNINIIYSYGLTEASPRVTYASRELLEQHLGTVGKPIKYTDVRIVNDSRECMPGEVGMIIVSGPGIMLGYYKNQQLSDATICNNYLVTGDLGYKDEYGNIYVVGRKDNMFICGGKNIYPEEIEEILMNTGLFQGVLVELNRNNEIIAYVEHPNKSLDYKELLDYCRNHLEDYKVPHRIIVVDIIEKTETGKLKRGKDKKF